MPELRPMDIRLADLETFLVVVRSGTINGAARQLSVTPSQVSKALARLERQLGSPLVRRSPQGVAVSDQGRDLTPRLVDVLTAVRALSRAEPAASDLTLATSSALAAFLVPAIIAALPGQRVHSVETQPGVPGAHAGASWFDVALISGAQHWPASWSQTRVGTIRKGLFASPTKARTLGRRPAAERLHGELFIGPIYNDRGLLVPGDDGCPLPDWVRRFGHRTETLALALSLARSSDQLVFAPTFAARELVARGELVEVPVRGWNVREPLQLVCHQDRIQARVERAMVRAIQGAVGAGG